MDIWEEKKQEFRQAVETYRKAVVDDFYAHYSADIDLSTPKQRIIELFQASPVEVRFELGFIVLRTMINPDGLKQNTSENTNRLKSLLIDVGIYFADELMKL